MSAIGITVRRHQVPTDAIPRHWYGGSALLSHATNALNLVFPAGERFFVRSVSRYMDRIEDPALLARVRAFAGQETQHGRAHEEAFVILEAQGYEIQSFLESYRYWAFDVLERAIPPVLRLSTTVALEHLTATLATQALTRAWLDDAPPAMRDLLRWHAAEEIEHKAVAFEVLQVVDDRYLIRISGMGIAVASLMFFWTRGIRHLTRQDPDVDRARLRRERANARARGQGRDFILKGVRSYLRRDFHPDDEDNRGLAVDWLAANGTVVSARTASC